MGSNPSTFLGGLHPLDNVSWCDAILFCNKLSALEGLEPCYILPKPLKRGESDSLEVKWNQQASGYRLPTEAEWEYAANAGEEYLYAGSDDFDEVGWGKISTTKPVGQKKPNAWDLYDMSGNIWEWCWDSGSHGYGDTVTDPVFVKISNTRICRGGDHGYKTSNARISYRNPQNVTHQGRCGFRFVRKSPVDG